MLVKLRRVSRQRLRRRDGSDGSPDAAALHSDGERIAH